jgi:hypothetical protein
MNRTAWFVAWALLGCAFALCAVSLGIFALLPAALLAAAMSRSPTGRQSAAGALTGAGLLLLFVAWINRQGPGTTCWERGMSSGCDQHLSPLPWLMLGLALVAGGFVVHRLRRH